jgi:putative transposase
MPWQDTSPMNERVKFVAGMLEGSESFTELCERFGISRKQGYKWKERYESGGVDALRDRSRAPKTHPQAVVEPLVDLIVQARKKHPRWGPRKLLVILARQYPTLEFPAASTVEGERCNPLTISDGCSRYLLCCKSLKSTVTEPVRRTFENVFREFGLPDAIRTDNGPPFSTLAPAGLSRLAVWWIRLGIRPERIMPGRPDQNGRHERMHLTLKAETARPPRSSFRAQQRAFDSFRDEYNRVRPHEALGYDTPASRYTPSSRPFPNKLPEIEYPSHFRIQRAQHNGVISVDGVQFYISNCIDEEYIGLEAVGDGCWKVYFGPIELGAHRSSSREAVAQPAPFQCPRAVGRKPPTILRTCREASVKLRGLPTISALGLARRP